MGIKDAVTGLTYSIQNDATGAELFDRLVTFTDAIIAEARKSSGVDDTGSRRTELFIVRWNRDSSYLVANGDPPVAKSWSQNIKSSFKFKTEDSARACILRSFAGGVEGTDWIIQKVRVDRASETDGERLRDLAELTRERDEARARAEAGDKANARLEARNAELEAQLAKVREFVAAFGATK